MFRALTAEDPERITLHLARHRPHETAGETDVNNGDLDPGRDFEITVSVRRQPRVVM